MSWYKKKIKTGIDKIAIASRLKMNRNSSVYEAILETYPNMADKQVMAVMLRYANDIRKMSKGMKFVTAEEKKLENQMKSLSKTNLDLIEDHVKNIKKLINSNSLEAWMVDKVATARNDLNDVKMGLMENNEDH